MCYLPDDVPEQVCEVVGTIMSGVGSDADVTSPKRRTWQPGSVQAAPGSQATGRAEVPGMLEILVNNEALSVEEPRPTPTPREIRFHLVCALKEQYDRYPCALF